MKNRESEKHLNIYLGLYVIIYIITYVIKSYIDFSLNKTTVLFSLTVISLGENALSAIGPTLIAIAIFNNYIWHWPIVKKICGIQTPYIAGRWEGHLRSSYSNYNEDVPIVVEMIQNINHIVVWYYDANAVTHSIISDIVLAAEGGPSQLLCIYENNPLVNYDKGLKKHIGVMELYVLTNEKEIKGTYFNNPLQKNSYGEMSLKFKSRKRKRSFS